MSANTLILASNLIKKLTISLVQAFLAPNNSIHALLIRHNHVDTQTTQMYALLMQVLGLRVEIYTKSVMEMLIRSLH